MINKESIQFTDRELHILNQYAKENNNKKFENVIAGLKKFSEAGIDISHYINQLLTMSIQHNLDNVLTMLLDIDDTDIYDSKSAITPLQQALKTGHHKIIKILLNAGAGIFADFKQDIPNEIDCTNVILIGSNLANKAQGITTIAYLKIVIQRNVPFSKRVIDNCQRLLQIKNISLCDENKLMIKKIISYLTYLKPSTTLKNLCLNLINTSVLYTALNLKQIPTDLQAEILPSDNHVPDKRKAHSKDTLDQAFLACIKQNDHQKFQCIMDGIHHFVATDLLATRSHIYKQILNALEYVILHQHKEILEKIIEYYPVHSLIILPNSKKHPLQYAIQIQSNVEIVQLLLRCGAGINAEIFGNIPKTLDTKDLILIGLKQNKKLVSHDSEHFKNAILTLSDLKKSLRAGGKLNQDIIIRNCSDMRNSLTDNADLGKENLLLHIIELFKFPICKQIPKEEPMLENGCLII